MKRVQKFLSIMFLILVCSFSFAQEEEIHNDSGMVIIPEIMLGFGVTAANSIETSFREEQFNVLDQVWQPEGKSGLCGTFGFRLNFYFNRNFNILLGMDYLYLKTGYDVLNTSHSNSEYRFYQSSLYFPLEFMMGGDFMVTFGGFLNYTLSAPEWVDKSDGISESSYEESGTFESRYWHPASFGISVGGRINASKTFSLFFQYRHGLTPWLETPFEKAYIRAFIFGLSFGFSND